LTEASGLSWTITAGFERFLSTITELAIFCRAATVKNARSCRGRGALATKSEKALCALFHKLVSAPLLAGGVGIALSRRGPIVCQQAASGPAKAPAFPRKPASRHAADSVS
jgi:hypothetical protein